MSVLEDPGSVAVLASWLWTHAWEEERRHFQRAGVHSLCLITSDSFHCDSFEPVPVESTPGETHLDFLRRGRNPPESGNLQQAPSVPLLPRSVSICEEVRDVGRLPIGAAAGESDGPKFTLYLLPTWSHSGLRVPICPLSSCNLRDGYSLHFSTQVWDVIGYRLYLPPPTQSSHPTSLTHTHTHTHRTEPVQLLSWLLGKHTVRDFFPLSLSLSLLDVCFCQYETRPI